MRYRPFGNTGIKLSVIGLGGHEYLPDGSSRGFNEDRGDAVKPGYTGVGYGGPQRLAVLEAALSSGINFFDVTIDPEKEALGRNLREVTIPHDIFIQTRPEGMGYSYDPGNRKMADAKLLRPEVERILKLLQRDTIDILNFPFLQSALDEDPDYLSKIRDNIAMLKDAQLIRFASADNFSGESTYLTQIASGIFDSISINFNFADVSARAKVFPAAESAGMGVITREVFQKGRLFTMGTEAGIEDRPMLARAALKWNLSLPQVTTSLVGARDTDQLINVLNILDGEGLTLADSDTLELLLATPTGNAFRESKISGFLT
jgi:aryl-alcohol dehydrogenase-like predicted oxidoreductase